MSRNYVYGVTVLLNLNPDDNYYSVSQPVTTTERPTAATLAPATTEATSVGAIIGVVCSTNTNFDHHSCGGSCRITCCKKQEKGLLLNQE